MTDPVANAHIKGMAVRVRGIVQGVGFRPTVWHLANECQLLGRVCNDGEGVLIHIWGTSSGLEEFLGRLKTESPPLARIDSIESAHLDTTLTIPDRFEIIQSQSGNILTGISPDAATCPDCLHEVLDVNNRRYRYPFTNCTHCGPRLSIIQGIPYDRVNTTMHSFKMCDACQAEYDDPTDRRFHAQPNACHTCGPRVWLEDSSGAQVDIPESNQDAIAMARQLIEQGKILAIKGIGGFHLACDACNTEVVSELRRRKRRYRKPFALMASSTDVIKRYCIISKRELAVLESNAAPIVVLEQTGSENVASEIAPGQKSLGFMLPYSPIHHQLLAEWDRPMVMTSGNLSDEPQCIKNSDAGHRLSDLADYFLVHDRDIANRVDDSVVRFMDDAPHLLRRARGYAPAPIPLPPGFEQAPQLMALGSELKNTICLLKDGNAIVSQHLGDLEELRTTQEYHRSIELYQQLFDISPTVLVADMHPDYRSTKFAKEWSHQTGLPIEEVQHHHAHIAACLADNDWPLHGGAVIGIALDGLGYGDDGTIWGGEFLLATYVEFERKGYLKPVPMPGGTKAIIEPWRNTYAHLVDNWDWHSFEATYPGLELTSFLQTIPLDIIDNMISRGLNSPLTSSCGRLFDAVAAAVGICMEEAVYEGQAAVELEAAASNCNEQNILPYPFSLENDNGNYCINPFTMWQALFDDLANDVAIEIIAERFHKGLAMAVIENTVQLSQSHVDIRTVVLSGGVFQNKRLFEYVTIGLRAQGFEVLSHRRVPSNDGGLSLGQAVVAAARVL